jgi:hypothetical protein
MLANFIWPFGPEKKFPPFPEPLDNCGFAADAPGLLPTASLKNSPFKASRPCRAALLPFPGLPRSSNIEIWDLKFIRAVSN